MLFVWRFWVQSFLVLGHLTLGRVDQAPGLLLEMCAIPRKLKRFACQLLRRFGIAGFEIDPTQQQPQFRGARVDANCALQGRDGGVVVAAQTRGVCLIVQCQHQ